MDDSPVGKKIELFMVCASFYTTGNTYFSLKQFVLCKLTCNFLYKRTLKGASFGYNCSFTCKHYTRLEMPTMDKYSILMGPIVSYEINKEL
jgi:hypothetical protein